MPKVIPWIDQATADALRLLGGQIREARHARKWTAEDLGERVGVTGRTVTAIESGKPTVAVGTVLRTALVVGVDLFEATSPEEIARLRRRGEERLALIPRRTFASTSTVANDSAF